VEIKKIGLITFIILSMFFVLVGCGAPKKYKVNFIFDDNVYHIVETVGNEYITLPEEPVKDGFEFAGWYTDKDVWEDEFTQTYLLNQTLSVNLVVYAKMVEIVEPVEDIEVKVYIDNELVDILYTNVDLGYKISLPDKPVDITTNPNSERYFYGWFTDYNYQTPITDNTIFMTNSKIYAKWIDVYSNNYTYSVDKGKATITGFNNVFSATTVVIPCYINSFPVESIGGNVFKNQKLLRNVVICDGIKSISQEAFYNCNSIETLILPSTLTYIGNGAFAKCELLESIDIPDTLENLGSEAFRDCKKIESITLTKQVTTIGVDIFVGCDNLSVFNYEGTLTDFIKFNVAKCGMFFKVDKCFIDGEELSDNLIIPSDLEYIPNSAFRGCKFIKNVVIPNTVKQIGGAAFYGCSEIESISIPFVGKSATEEPSSDTVFGFIFGSVKYEGSIETVQYYCQSYSTKYYIPSKLTKVVINFGDVQYGAFYNCKSLVDIEINGVGSIGTDAFYNCESLENVYYKGSLTNWCAIEFGNANSNPMSFASHFYLQSSQDWVELTSITTPAGVNSILPYTFYGFNNVSNIVVSDEVTSIGVKAFENCTSLISLTTPIIGGSGNVDYNYSFKGSTLLKNITLTKSNDMVNNAFSSCVNLENVYFNGSIDAWLNMDFGNQYSNPMVYADNFYFWDEDEYKLISELQISNSLHEIKQYALYGFNNLTTVIIGESVTDIGVGAFGGCANINDLIINSKTINFKDNVFINAKVDNVYYNGDVGDWTTHGFNNIESTPMSCADKCYMKNSEDDYYVVTKLEIPSLISSVKKFQFYGFKDVTSIIVPTSVKLIEGMAFAECNSLESITLPFVGSYIDNFDILDDERYFAWIFDCEEFSNIPKSLKEVVITGGYDLSYDAFKNCFNITKLTLPSTLIYIESALEDCTSLEYLTIPFAGHTSTLSLPNPGGYKYNERFGYIFGYFRVWWSDIWSEDNKLNNYNYYSHNESDYVYYYYIPKSLIEVVITDSQNDSAAFYKGDTVEGYSFRVIYK